MTRTDTPIPELFESDLSPTERTRLESFMRTRIFVAMREHLGLRLDNLHAYPLANPAMAEPCSGRHATWIVENEIPLHGWPQDPQVLAEPHEVIPRGAYFVIGFGGGGGKITNLELDHGYLARCRFEPGSEDPLCSFDQFKDHTCYIVDIDNDGHFTVRRMGPDLG